MSANFSPEFHQKELAKGQLKEWLESYIEAAKAAGLEDIEIAEELSEVLIDLDCPMVVNIA